MRSAIRDTIITFANYIPTHPAPIPISRMIMGRPIWPYNQPISENLVKALLPELKNITATGPVIASNKNTFTIDDIDGKNEENFGKGFTNKQLLKIAMKILVHSLLCDHQLNLDNSLQNQSLVYKIFKAFPAQERTKIIDSYQTLQASDFMSNMRERYMNNGIIKSNLTYSDVIQDMFSIEYKNISGFDKFCNFFAYFIKAIMYCMGKEYKSTQDLKRAHNTRVEDIQDQDTNGGWQQFAAMYKLTIKHKLDLSTDAVVNL